MAELALDDPDVLLYRGDSRVVLAGLPEIGADAIVTSPPYADARGDDYEAAAPDEYVEWFLTFLPVFAEALKLDGGLMLNLGRKFKDGMESSYVERLLIAMEDQGWKRIDTIVWGKINGRPVNPYLTNVHESVYWMTRGDALAVYRGYDEVRYPYAPETLLRYQRKWTNHADRKSSGETLDDPVQDGRTPHEQGSRPRSLYVTQVGKEKGIRHPAPMALDLARFLVCLSTPPGGLVLDPFAGSGSTAVAARLHGRRALLVEQEKDYADEAVERLAQQSLFA